jgi:G:T/U-mismatch repair DNA glycosylase
MGQFGPNFERSKKKFQPRCLIIGSLTSPQGFINGQGYYYASPKNYFWKLLAEVEEHHLAFGQWHDALSKGTKKQTRASISKIKKGLDKCGIILCDILASAAVKDINKASDDGIVLFDQDHPESPGIQTVYYDQLIKEMINEYQIHFVFYNGGLTKRCLDKKGIKTCEDYQVIRLTSPAARKTFEEIEKEWKAVFLLTAHHINWN